MSSHARVLFFVGIATLAATAAAAQPHVFAIPSPPANERGWMNTFAQVEFLCARATRCTDTIVIREDGGGQVVRGTAEGEAGDTATTEITLNIDGTAPVVRIESSSAATTSATSIAVTARASDEVSGLMSATCNGRPVPIADKGIIRCEVPLLVGANDIVVEASDRADNSGSAGFRIVRVVPATKLTVLPENIGMIVGQVTTVQVHDDAGLPARGVVWQSTDPSIGEMSSDGRHVFAAKAPGRAWLTASSGAVSGSILISVYEGDRLPPWSTRWQIGPTMILQTPETQPLKAGDTVDAVTTKPYPDAPTTIESINRTTGWLNWRERPATHAGELATAIRQMPIGGGAIVAFNTVDGRSALLRSGGAQWRYQFPNRIRPELVLTSDGGIVVLETTPAGFVRLVVLNGATGRVAGRRPLASGTHVVLNAGCVKGAHRVRHLPAQVGPLNMQGRMTHFGIVVSDDVEDFGVCGQVNGSFNRRITMVTLGGEERLDAVATLEGSPAAHAPDIELFEVTVDRHDGKLLPWATRDRETGAREFRVTRFDASGSKEFKLPAAGKLWLSGLGDDFAITTDGFRVVGFNLVTGAIRYIAEYAGGVRILGVDKGSVHIESNGPVVMLPVPPGPPE
ncbi:MAG TPA: hypothetical protein VFZ31_08225 [Vicinamibacterales bacterium]